MCGRFTLFDTESIYERFHLTHTAAENSPHYNVAPSQTMPVVVNHGSNRLEMMRWGLIPSWAKDASIGNKMINARAESVAVKPAYRKAFRTQRCLIPANGFFEWKQTTRGKIPYFIRCKDAELFGFAGLYDTWRDAEGTKLKSYTIMTTQPNDLVNKIHNRMPVILPEQDEESWLNPNNTDTEALLALLKPYPTERLEAYPVSTRVNNPANDSRENTQPV